MTVSRETKKNAIIGNLGKELILVLHLFKKVKNWKANENAQHLTLIFHWIEQTKDNIFWIEQSQNNQSINNNSKSNSNEEEKTKPSL